MKILKEGSATVFDVGEWRSAVASRKNDDGTVSFITIDPTLSGFEFVVADEDGKRRLITRDAQRTRNRKPLEDEPGRVLIGGEEVDLR